MLSVKGLAKRFGSREVFSEVSFDVERGTSMVIMGPSGCGKSTLLRCLNGLEDADAGEVHVGNHSLRALDSPLVRAREKLAIRRCLGFVFQGFHLFSHRTVEDNILLASVVVRGDDPADARTRAQTLAQDVGIAHRLKAFPHELSGGEQQRAAIARALAMDPECLLLDEPTSAVDEERTIALVRLLHQLQERGLAIVAVSHDGVFARALTSQVFRLRDGALVRGEHGA